MDGFVRVACLADNQKAVLSKMKSKLKRRRLKERARYKISIRLKGKINMIELLKTIVAELVEDRDAVEITCDEPNEDGVIVYHLHVAPDDMGRVIGKQGRIAKAIRTLMRAGAARVNQKIMVEID